MLDNGTLNFMSIESPVEGLLSYRYLPENHDISKFGLVRMLWTENFGLTGSRIELKYAVIAFEVWLKGVFCLSIRAGVPVSKSKIAGVIAPKAYSGVQNRVEARARSKPTAKEADTIDTRDVRFLLIFSTKVYAVRAPVPWLYSTRNREYTGILPCFDPTSSSEHKKHNVSFELTYARP